MHRAHLPLVLGIGLALASSSCSQSEVGGDAAASAALGASDAPSQSFPSGLELTHLREGTGSQPVASSTVRVHYHGTLPDGSVFDSSVERGEPASFPLDRVIACWTEGVQQMKVGGKARLVCPPAIAYGPRGRPPVIPPNATLIFEVELLDVL